MDTLTLAAFSLGAAAVLIPVTYLLYLTFIWPRRNPITILPGPPSNRLLELRHMSLVMEYVSFSLAVIHEVHNNC